MARVEAMSFSAASIQNLALSKKGKVPMAAGGADAKQFEQFLKNDNPQNKVGFSKDTAGSGTAQEKLYEVNNGAVRQENLQTAQSTGVESTPDAKELTTEDLQAVEAAGKELRDIVKSILDIDDKTLDAAMQNMGIVLTDLLNPEVLQQFVLLANGAEGNVDFLTDEGLLQDFTNLMQALEDFGEENQNILSLMEKLDNPVSLDEFLMQEGVTLTDKVPEGTEEVTVQTSAGQVAELAQPVQETAVTDSRALHTADTVSDKPVVENTVVQSTAKGAGEEAQDSLSEEASGQNENDLLFAQSEEVSGDVTRNTVATPLFADSFNNFLEDGVRFLKPDFTVAPRMQQMIDIVNQVSETIRSSVNADTTSVEMQLNPESLGKVFLSVVSKGGTMTATFHVQTDEAKNALESQILILRENLEAKNLKVESVEVHVSDFSFTQSNQAEGQNPNAFEKQGKKKFRYDAEEAEGVEVSEAESAEAVRRQVMRDAGGSIDFTA